MLSEIQANKGVCLKAVFHPQKRSVKMNEFPAI
jgi:hypothetical protein